MVLSAAQIAKRAFVRILLAFATQYQVSLSVSRDSADKEILTAYRRLVKKVHPDKGGKKEDQQKLQNAKVEWEGAAASARKGAGRPRQSHAKAEDAAAEGIVDVEEKGTYQVHSQGVLLTYNGWSSNLSSKRTCKKWKVLANSGAYLYKTRSHV